MPDLLSLAVLVYMGIVLVGLPLADWIQRRIAWRSLVQAWKAKGLL